MPRFIDNVEKRRLTRRQVDHLAAEAGLEPDALARLTVGDAIKELQFRVDSRLLIHRKICGQVVRINPVTGEKEPVPHATVHVEDTDCRFLGFFPVEDPWWWWLWLVSCERETLAKVTTDECGRFCVLVPRWDIDYVLKLRRRWVCPPRRPWLTDLLDHLPDPSPIGDPHIGPPVIDPKRVLLDRPVRREFAHTSSAERVMTEQRLAPLLGSNTPQLEGPAEVMLGQAPPERLRRPIHELPVAAPLSSAARERAFAVHGEVAERAFRGRPVGPFLRCHQVTTLEWSPIIDLPDITFRVTQDIDGDGDEETIYAESFFEVRWDDDSHEEIELVASTSALSTPACGLAEVACQDVPAILAAGRMPLLEAGDTPAYHDHATGYAVRPNRPKNPPNPRPDAEAPYARDLQLVGCVDSDDSAAFYRVVYDFGDATGLIFSEEWVSAADPTVVPSGTVTISPDAQGWYAIADIQQQLEDHWLLNWRTARYANGRYDVKLEIADAGKNKIDESAVVPFVIDNARPSVGYQQIYWTQGADGGPVDGNLLGVSCPTIVRPDPTQAVRVTVHWSVAAEHYRNAQLSGYGCDGGSLNAVGGDALEHWHASVTETGDVWTTTFEIPGGAAPGAYGLTARGWGRGFSPAGATGPGVDWETDALAPNYNASQFRFAVVV